MQTPALPGIRLSSLAAIMLGWLIALPASAQTDTEEPFVGLGIAQHRLHFDSDDRSAVDIGREDEPGLQLKVGLIRPDYRLYGRGTLINASDSFITSLTVNADYLWRVAHRLTLYGGVGGGAITLSWDGDNSLDTMPVVSLQTGALIALTRQVDLEIGLQQNLTRLRTELQGAEGERVDVDLDRFGVAAAGINVRF